MVLWKIDVIDIGKDETQMEQSRGTRQGNGRCVCGLTWVYTHISVVWMRHLRMPMMDPVSLISDKTAKQFSLPFPNSVFLLLLLLLLLDDGAGTFSAFNQMRIFMLFVRWLVGFC